VEPVGEGRVRVLLRARGSVDRLEIAGEWSDWEAVSLARHSDGRWITELQLEPGVYRYALLADGEWTVPEGAVTVSDEFGGVVALLVVR
jgi:hypothetical protein